MQVKKSHDLTVREVADLAGRSTATIRRYLATGFLKGRRLGPREWRIPPAEAARLVGQEEAA